MTRTRIILLLLSAFSSCPLFADELVLLNWDDYLSTEVVQRFEDASGHQIKTTTYDSDEQRDEILASRSGQQFDLVVIDNTAAQLFGKNNLLHAVDRRSIPNSQHIMPRWQESCGNFGTPYFWGTLGIVYRSDKLDFTPNSWLDLLQPRAAVSGHIVMLLDFIDTLIPAFKVAGASISTENIDDVKAAFALLQQQKPHVLSYDFALSYLEQGPHPQQLYMALSYSGDQYSLNDVSEHNAWRYIIPKEGTAIWVDCLAVVESSTKKAAAVAFIDFINRPDMAALNANTVGTATANGAAMALLTAEIAADRSIYPEQSQLENSELYRIISDKSLSQRNRIIRSIKK